MPRPAAAVFRHHYVEMAATCTQARPGAHESLTAVPGAGMSAATVTAKHEVSVPPWLAATGLRADYLFAHVHDPEKPEVLQSERRRLYR